MVFRSSDASPAPTRGEKITLDGKDYFLRYTWGTRKRLIAELGGEDKLRDGLAGENLTKVLLAGLKHGDQAGDLTAEQLDDMVDLRDIADVASAMARAMGYREASVKVGAENPTPAAAASAP